MKQNICSPQREYLRSLTNLGSYQRSHSNAKKEHHGTTTNIISNAKKEQHGTTTSNLSILRSRSNSSVTKQQKTKQKTALKRKLSKDMIRLRVDRTHFQVGDTITGSIELKEDAPISLVKLVFEGIEYTVVALSQTRDNHMGLEYLERHTSETNVLTSQQVVVDVSEAPTDRSKRFSFVIPNGLPGTMSCILDGSDPILPSQYKANYTITASIFKNTSKAQVIQTITVSPQSSKTAIPTDSSTIQVSVLNPVKSIASTLFQCGSTTLVHDDNTLSSSSIQNAGAAEMIIEQKDKQEVFLNRSSQLFSLKLCQPPPQQNCFAVGQVISVQVMDWLGRQLSGIWMFQLIEEMAWSAKGRKATMRNKWNLFANHHELPATLQSSYFDSSERSRNYFSKLSVKHYLVVFLATDEEDPSREVIACSEPFPIVIVSHTRGWDA